VGALATFAQFLLGLVVLGLTRSALSAFSKFILGGDVKLRRNVDGGDTPRAVIIFFMTLYD
jgi:hypothetical protein